MIQNSLNNGHIRQLSAKENGEFLNHLLGLDKKCRFLRFGSVVSDQWIQDYVAQAFQNKSVILGFFDTYGVLRGSAELQFSTEQLGLSEAAFTVDPICQGFGIGSLLMMRIIQEAYSRELDQVSIYCLLENKPMMRIAKKFGGQFAFECGMAHYDIQPSQVAEQDELKEAV